MTAECMAVRSCKCGCPPGLLARPKASSARRLGYLICRSCMHYLRRTAPPVGTATGEGASKVPGHVRRRKSPVSGPSCGSAG